MGSISQYCPQTKQYGKEKISAEPGFEPGAPGWEARTLPLCYAAAAIIVIILIFSAGQKIRSVVARGGRRGIRLRDLLRVEEPDVHVFRRELGRLCLEVLVRRKAVPSKAVPSKAVPSKTVPSKAVPSKAVPSKAVPSKAVLLCWLRTCKGSMCTRAVALQAVDLLSLLLGAASDVEKVASYPNKDPWALNTNVHVNIGCSTSTGAHDDDDQVFKVSARSQSKLSTHSCPILSRPLVSDCPLLGKLLIASAYPWFECQNCEPSFIVALEYSTRPESRNWASQKML